MKEFFKALAGLKIALPYSGKVVGLQAQLIWQFLRFNEKYRSGYDKLKIAARGDESGELPMYFARSWCLSTTMDYNYETFPVEKDDDGTDISPYFEYTAVSRLPKWKYLKDWGDILLPDERQLFLLNPYAPPDQVARVLAGQKDVYAENAIRSLRQAQLVDYIVCHYYLKKLGMGPTEFSPIFHEVFDTNQEDILQTAKLQGKVNGFNEVVALAPWSFFTPPHR